MTVEDIKSLFEIMQELLQSWMLLLLIFLCSSAVLILGYLPLYNDKLYSMMNTQTIAFTVWIITLTALILKGIAGIHSRYKIKRRNREAIKKALDFVLNLPSAEKAILKYVYTSTTSAVYFPYDNPAVLGLWKEGALRRVVNVIFPRNGKQCFLYDMMPQLRTLITQNYGLLNWEEVTPPDELGWYQ